MKKLIERTINRLENNPNQHYWILLPFLLIYILLVIFGLKEGFRKDEWRYIYYAENLIKGMYSPEGKVFLWNGPGYPLLIAVLLTIKWPLILIKILNAFFLYFSLVFFYKSIKYYHNTNIALVATLVLGIYIPGFEMLPYLMTEPFTTFLVSGILWTSISYFNATDSKKIKFIRLAMLVAILALTKVIFGYVILCLLLILLPSYLIIRNPAILKSFKVLAVSLLICLPYIAYTYNVTGKVFYWSNAGGMQIYWMSSPHKGEHGDWINFISPVSKFDDANQLFAKRHGKVIAEAFDYPSLFSGIETDELIEKSNLSQDLKFKQHAIENIKNNPGKYIQNWGANISRMLFDVPYSYKTQSLKFIKYVLFHIPLLLLLIIGFVKQITSKKSLSFLAVLLLLFSGIYIGGSSLMSAYPRQFYIMIPMLMFMAVTIVAGIYQPKPTNKR